MDDFPIDSQREQPPVLGEFVSLPSSFARGLHITETLAEDKKAVFQKVFWDHPTSQNQWSEDQIPKLQLKVIETTGS